ncbi:MAG: seg [Parcubacteria group bacterium]|nr:seg [Parcubacteria group bacterium]
MKNKHHSGFTLVETLVAISVLLLSVTGAFSAARNGIISATYSKDQVIAFYLAAEAVEEIRNIRDTNGLNPSHPGWLTGIAAQASDPCYFGKVCTIDIVNTDVNGNPTIATCSGGSGTCPVLKLDPTYGFYGYSAGWKDTIFNREIKLKQINADEVSILVSVIWKKGVVNRTFNIRENIFNWQ